MYNKEDETWSMMQVWRQMEPLYLTQSFHFPAWIEPITAKNAKQVFCE